MKRLSAKRRTRAAAAGSPPSPSLVDADQNAASALAAVDEDPQTQIAALRALEALVHACRTSGATILAHEAARLLDERKDTMRAFHLERVEHALARTALAGARDEAVRVLENALVVIGDIDGDVDGGGGAVRTLRTRLDDVKRGLPGKPRPFFARYLEHQKR